MPKCSTHSHRISRRCIDCNDYLLHVGVVCKIIKWVKFSQKHNYKYMAKWWCLLAMGNYMFLPIAAIIKFWQLLAIRVLYNIILYYIYKTIENYMFRHISAIIRFWQLLAIRVLYNIRHFRHILGILGILYITLIARSCQNLMMAAIGRNT